MASSSSSSVFPDMHHKMSKKIAQLTKVIYHLNTRNEDHQAEMDSLNIFHQSELQMVVRDASTKISKFKELVDSHQNSVNIESKLENLRKKLDEEKSNALKEMQSLRLKYESRESKLAREYQMKFDSMVGEVESMNSTFSYQIEKFESANRKLKSSLEAANSSGAEGMNELKFKHDSEVAELVKNSNAKFQQMLIEQMQAQEVLRNEMLKKIEEEKAVVKATVQKEWDQSLGQLRAELTGDKQEALMMLRHEYDEKMKQQQLELSVKLEHVSSEIKLKTDEYGELLLQKVRQAEDYEKKLQGLEQQLNGLRTELSSAMGDDSAARLASKEHIDQLQSDLLQFRAKVAEREEEIDRLQSLLDANATKFVSLEAEFAASKEAARRLQAELAAAGGATAATEAELRSKLLASEAETLKVQALASSLNSDLMKMRDTVDFLRDEALRLREEHSKQLSEAKLEGESLRKKCEDLTSSMSSAHAVAGAEISVLSQKIKDMEARSKTDIDEFEDNWCKRLASAAESHRLEIDEMRRLQSGIEDNQRHVEVKLREDLEVQKKQFERDLDELKASHQEKIDILLAGHRTEQDALKTSISSLEFQLGEVSKQADGEKNILKVEVSKLDTKAKNLQKELESRKSESERAESVCNGLKNQVESLREELKSSQQAFRDKMDASRAKIDSDWQAKLDSLADQQVTAIVELSEELKRHHSNEIEALRCSYEEDINTLKNAIQKEASQASSELTRSEQEKLKLLSMLTDERATTFAEIENMKNAHIAILSEQSVKHKKEVDLLRDDLKASFDSRERRLQEDQAAEAQRISTMHKTDIETLEATLRAEFESKITEHKNLSIEEKNATIEMLTASNKREMASVEEQHASSMKSLQCDHSVQVDKFRSDINETHRQLSDFQTKIISLEETVTRNIADNASMCERFEREKDQIVRDSISQIRQEKEKNEMSILDTENRARENIQVLTDEFNEKKSSFEQEKQFLVKELDALNEKWLSRDSRPEDLERIRELEVEMIDKDHLVKKTKDEMMYFKREMLNREENYNQKFGAQPTVGVMQVIKTKDLKKAQPAAKKL